MCSDVANPGVVMLLGSPLLWHPFFRIHAAIDFSAVAGILLLATSLLQYSVTTDDGVPSDVGVSAVMVLLPFLAFMLLTLMANLLPSLILVANLPPVSTTLVVNESLLTD